MGRYRWREDTGGGNQGGRAQERQPRTEHEKDRQGPNRSNLDLSLKEAQLGDCFNSKDRGFQYLGAMLLMDLESDLPIKKLLLAPLVE